MNLIEMVPLVKDFDGERDRENVEALAKRYWSRRGSKSPGIATS
jgi:hypothetical protein